MQYPNFREEKKLWRRGYRYVAGLDEAGRGPLAGPVVAAAVVINSGSKFLAYNAGKQFSNLKNLGVKDSKKLSPEKREKLYKILTNHPAVGCGVGVVSEKMIDKINIKNAAELAMEKAATQLKRQPDFLIIDGNHLKNYKLKTMNYKLIIKADEKVFPCAAASIIAKVWRDRIMQKLHKKYPQYGFNQHKGYATKYHLKMLKKYGFLVIHRRTFQPIKNSVKINKLNYK